jgi:membrane-bound lytic murein transglycosylase A
MKRTPAAAAVLCALFFLAQCGRGPGKGAIRWTFENSLTQAKPPTVGDDESADSLKKAIECSLAGFEKIPGDRTFRLGGEIYPLSLVKESLTDMRNRLVEMGLGDDFFRYLREHYLFFQSSAREVRFTGYYEPLLRGSLQPSDTYRYPIYRKPDDLLTIDLSRYYFFQKFPDLPPQIRGRLTDDNRVIPYFSREEIDFEGKLNRKNLEVLWIDDLIAVFFLQIQGSGMVELENGQVLRIGYSDQNGQPYRSIGRMLVDSGYLKKDEASMQGIRSYLKCHPEEWRRMLSSNPSYIFFRVLENGPLGSFGVPLTPGRSIATDNRIFPPGLPVLIETEKPVFNERKEIVRWEKFRRLVLNQDTGGAIRGPARVDLFTGSGDGAERTAGHMMQKGTFYFLIQKKP